MTRRAILFFLCCGLFFPSCGRKGPLLPPLVRVPQAIQDLALRQRGRQIILTWTNPSAYVDGNPLASVSEVEIWMAEERKDSKGGMSMDDFRGRAKLLAKVKPGQPAATPRDGGPDTGLSYAYIPESAGEGTMILTFALRAQDARKRVSEFSEPRSITVRTMPDPPRGLRAVVFADHIEVRWESAEAKTGAAAAAETFGYNIYRAEEKAPAAVLNPSPVKEQEYHDSDIVFGRTYRYFIRTAAVSPPPQAESEDSETVEVEAKDSFPPAAPMGLTAVAGSGLIALSWEAGPEPDLAGYRVWRKEETQGQFVLLQELGATDNSYSDSRVEKNRRYVYAITAVDTAGNESPKSNPASGIMRDGPD